VPSDCGVVCAGKTVCEATSGARASAELSGTFAPEFGPPPQPIRLRIHGASSTRLRSEDLSAAETK
jgi:hypothetical protein